MRTSIRPGADWGRLDPRALQHYRTFFSDPLRIHATCEDYRAGATLDLAADEADLGVAHAIGDIRAHLRVERIQTLGAVKRQDARMFANFPIDGLIHACLQKGGCLDSRNISFFCSGNYAIFAT